MDGVVGSKSFEELMVEFLNLQISQHPSSDGASNAAPAIDGNDDEDEEVLFFTLVERMGDSNS